MKGVVKRRDDGRCKGRLLIFLHGGVIAWGRGGRRCDEDGWREDGWHSGGKGTDDLERFGKQRL